MFPITDDLHHHDQNIHHTCEAKMAIILDMLQVFGHDDVPANVSGSGTSVALLLGPLIHLPLDKMAANLADDNFKCF